MSIASGAKLPVHPVLSELRDSPSLVVGRRTKHSMDARSWLIIGASRHGDQQAGTQEPACACDTAPVISDTCCGNEPVASESTTDSPISNLDACVIQMTPPVADSSSFIKQAMADTGSKPAGTTTVTAPGGGSTAALPPTPAAQHAMPGVLDAAAAADASPTSKPDAYDTEAPPQLLTSTSSRGLARGSSSSSSSSSSRECRICLSGDNSRDLIQPCSCAGTMRYTHASCLSSWVEEKGSLVCEVCGQCYQELHAAALAPIVAAARQHKGQTGETVGADTSEEAEDSSPLQLVCGATPGTWLCLLMSLILLAVSFVVLVISTTRSKRQQAAAA